MMRSLHQCSLSLWQKICQKVNRAVVFTDDVVAENLHWNGGLTLMLEAGAINVKEFSSFESVDHTCKKAVFIVSSMLQEVTSRVIQNIIEASKLQYVVVITTVSPCVHMFSRTGSCDGDENVIFERFEESILEWMGNMNYTAEVSHVPLFATCLTPSLFVTPSFSRLFPLMSSDLPRLSMQYKSVRGDNKSFSSLKDVEAAHLPKTLQILYKMLVGSIDSMLGELNVQEDCFFVGQTSKILATELASYPPAKLRRKSAQTKVSLLLVDRHLDLMTPCQHQPEVLMDKMTSMLPRLPGHHNDVYVDMTPLCRVISESKEVIAPGSLAGCKGQTTQSHLLPLLNSKVKEGLMEVNRSLVEAASTEKLPLKLSGKPGRVTAEQLDNTLKLFKGNYKAISNHIETVQVAMATCQCLKSSKGKEFDLLGSMEKLMIQSVGSEEGQGPLPVLLSHLEKTQDKSLQEMSQSLDSMLTQIVYVYSLLGENASYSDEEVAIKKLLVKRIVSGKDDLPKLTKMLVGDLVTEEIVSAILDDMFDKLKAVSTARQHLKHMSCVVEPSTTLSPAKGKPLLKQLMDLTFDSTKGDVQDIEYISSGFTDLLKSGFGLFRTVAKPKPSDNKMLIVFVLGGITATEAKMIRETVASHHSDTQVIVGSTQLSQPEDVVETLLCQDNLNPD
ncbi:sec1 family domain-containing protein 2-like [Ylistrum balloti]|uniref:sec1 family domain-containing protein 2-like n=1 Tax=Ylistrum balloti TaxID=509963 RepID=UPI00290587D7|nr:sec1 family domain-containing protein 2-like [Ylistrum balloti]